MEKLSYEVIIGDECYTCINQLRLEHQRLLLQWAEKQNKIEFKNLFVREIGQANESKIKTMDAI